MSGSLKSLTTLTIGCAVAATIFGFGSSVFSFQASSAGEFGRTQLILFTRLAVLGALALVLVFKGGWKGVFAAIAMTAVATTIEWALFPFAYEFALAQPPPQQDIPDGAIRPSYGVWAMEDIIGIGICAALAQGLRMMAHVDPEATPERDE